MRLPSASRFLFRRSELSCISSYSIWCMGTTPAELSVAFRIEDESQIGFWDALIVAAAAKSGSARLLSEDLNPGQKIAGLRIENPFVAVP